MLCIFLVYIVSDFFLILQENAQILLTSIGFLLNFFKFYKYICRRITIYEET